MEFEIGQTITGKDGKERIIISKEISNGIMTSIEKGCTWYRTAIIKDGKRFNNHTSWFSIDDKRHMPKWLH